MTYVAKGHHIVLGEIDVLYYVLFNGCPEGALLRALFPP